MKKYLTKAERAKFSLSAESKVLLGDLNANKQNVNARLRFKQGIIHEGYLRYLYEQFKDFCPAGPKIENLLPDKRTGIVYSSIYFSTYSLPCFNELYELFYPEGKKIIPLNIADLLTARGLAYWICDDGSRDKLYRYVVLCTNSFTLEEVELLINVLNSKWNF